MMISTAPNKAANTERPRAINEPHLLRRFVRANQIARSSRTQAPLIDISVATWWRWVKSGRALQPKRLSPGTTVWDLNEVIDFIKKCNGAAKC